MKLSNGWKKVPSVTYGGKPFFYFRMIGDTSHSVVWDRFEHKWSYSFNHEHVSFHETAKEGMKQSSINRLTELSGSILK
jgi:hypothetical protein